jgi:excisionase family DNA binding protein
MSAADRLLTQREVCQALRISPKTLQRWRRDGRIRFCSLGYRSIRIRESAISHLLARYEQGGAR